MISSFRFSFILYTLNIIFQHLAYLKRDSTSLLGIDLKNVKVTYDKTNSCIAETVISHNTFPKKKKNETTLLAQYKYTINQLQKLQFNKRIDESFVSITYRKQLFE